MTKLTSKQSAVLAYIRESIAVRGYPPTVREMGAKFGVAINAIAGHLKALEKKGLIVREPGMSRAIKVVELEGA